MQGEVERHLEIIQKMRSIVALLRLFTLFGDGHFLGIRHTKAETPAEHLFFAPRRIALAHRGYIRGITRKSAVAFIFLEMTKQRDPTEEVNAITLGEQPAKR